MAQNLNPYGEQDVPKIARATSMAWATFDVFSGLTLVVFSITIAIGQISKY